MPINTCLKCNEEYSVKASRLEASKFCSMKCKWDFNGWDSSPNTECSVCKKMFHLKPYAKKRFKRSLGFFCSNTCSGIAKKSSYSGEKNPNYRGVTKDSDGYALRIYSPQSVTALGLVGRYKLHQAVCCEILGVSGLPKGAHVHHRDCDVLNNVAENLVVLTVSDHKWLHKQYGNATLWAYCHGKVGLDDMVSWSDDKERARKLIALSVKDQSIDRIIADIESSKTIHKPRQKADETMRAGGGFGSTGR